MVLTNFECWAHGGGGSDGGGSVGVGHDLELGTTPATRHVDLFNPRSVRGHGAAATVSQISSNGYYGFSHVNPLQELNSFIVSSSRSNNNNNLTIDNNNNNNNNNNDVNEINNNNNDAGNNNNYNIGNANNAIVGAAAGVLRCKKRFFVSCDVGVDVDADSDADYNMMMNMNGGAAKRCRFDDDFAAAEYCNDFFSLPSTQIGTQSCLMETEDYIGEHQEQHQEQQQQQQQQQRHNLQQSHPVSQLQPKVDVTLASTMQNCINLQSNSYFFSHQLQQLEQQSHPIPPQTDQELVQQQQQQHQQHQQQQHQHQHLYQGHLHRANRDVSRCLLSHMI